METFDIWQRGASFVVPPAFNADETYTLTATGGIVRNSDGAHIPADEANADYRAFLAWEASGKTAAPYVAPFNPDAVSAECKRRIFAVASTNAQVNMAAARAAGILSPAQEAAFLDGLTWTQAMRAACETLIAASDKTFAEDAHWPACPADVIALADAF